MVNPSTPSSHADSPTPSASDGRREKAHLLPRKVPVNRFRDVRPIVQMQLSQLKQPFIKLLEEETGMGREKLFYIAVSAVVCLLLFSRSNLLISTIISAAYPVHQSIVTIYTQAKTEEIQWLSYWCLFALFSLCDLSFSVALPFYALVKTTILLYLALPQTYGAHNFYVVFVDPMMDQWMIMISRIFY